MASAFGHAAAAFAISRLGLVKTPNWLLLLLGIVLSILPDADSIGFLFGVPYNSFWGHRGFTHSIAFAFIIAAAITWIFYHAQSIKAKIFICLFLFFCCISHAVLDAMTTGGLGVAFFAPFNNTRYFFKFRPIKVSPINVGSFFKDRIWIVLKSEAYWIGLPTLIIYLGSVMLTFIKRKISN